MGLYTKQESLANAKVSA